MPLINCSAATDKGLQRSNNEDCYLSLPDNGLWLIADGMGGHEAGEVASAIVVDTVKKSIENGKSLIDSIQIAHDSVLQAVVDGQGANGMGSTVVALESINEDYHVAWVGDSRAYLWTPEKSGGVLEQLSTDHSYVQMLLASGAIKEEEVANHPDKNVITQCIGSTDVGKVNVDSVHGQWSEGQWILLCSDGLTDEISDELIAQTLCNARSVRDAVGRLLGLALSNGGRDNITIQIVESPLTKNSMLTSLWEWLPILSGHRFWDGLIYSVTLLSFLLLCYWLWI